MAYVNLACYYVIGLPVGVIMGWVFHMGVEVFLAFSLLSNIFIFKLDKFNFYLFYFCSDICIVITRGEIAGNMGRDDFWWNCTADDNIGYFNLQM